MFNRMVEYHQDALNRVFSAVADPTRRAILQVLAQGSATISEIARPFPVSLNAVSKHVMVLERAGLVHRKIQGRVHLCSLEPRPLREATEWLDYYRQFWEVRLDAFARYVARKTRDTRKRGGKHGRFQ
jgi:DNA-binding transcriptional ArsR family regulator